MVGSKTIEAPARTVDATGTPAERRRINGFSLGLALITLLATALRLWAIDFGVPR